MLKPRGCFMGEEPAYLQQARACFYLKRNEFYMYQNMLKSMSQLIDSISKAKKIDVLRSSKAYILFE